MIRRDNRMKMIEFAGKDRAFIHFNEREREREKKRKREKKDEMEKMIKSEFIIGGKGFFV